MDVTLTRHHPCDNLLILYLDTVHITFAGFPPCRSQRDTGGETLAPPASPAASSPSAAAASWRRGASEGGGEVLGARRRLLLLGRRRSSLQRWEAGAAAPGRGAAEVFSSHRGVADPVSLSPDLQGRWASRLWWLPGGGVARGPVWCCGSRGLRRGTARWSLWSALPDSSAGHQPPWALLRGGAGNATCRLCCRGGMQLCSVPVYPWPVFHSSRRMPGRRPRNCLADEAGKVVVVG
jgi:hypothetical protein